MKGLVNVLYCVDIAGMKGYFTQIRSVYRTIH